MSIPSTPQLFALSVLVWTFCGLFVVVLCFVNMVYPGHLSPAAPRRIRQHNQPKLETKQGHHTDPSGVMVPSSKGKLWASTPTVGLGA